MFKCTWCKKEMDDVSLWTEDKEPLCSECENKYIFALKQKIFNCKVSDLTKEKRREISEVLHRYQKFSTTMSSICKEKLSGKWKITAYILFALCVFGTYSLMVNLFEPILSNQFLKTLPPFPFSLFIYIPLQIVILFIIGLLLEIVNFVLKFLQLWLKIRRAGF